MGVKKLKQLTAEQLQAIREALKAKLRCWEAISRVERLTDDEVSEDVIDQTVIGIDSVSEVDRMTDQQLIQGVGLDDRFEPAPVVELKAAT